MIERRTAPTTGRPSSRSFRRSIALPLAIAAFVFAPQPSYAFETTAPTAFMTDYTTGDILFAKNADLEIEPASLAKLMTVAVVFDALKAGTLTRDQTFTVSENAWRTGGASSGGSTMFLPLGSDVSVDDLIKGIIIQSGNDATIVIAEGMAGSVEAFAQRMNEEARKIGLTHSNFGNSSGLPDPDSRVTVRDLVKLADYIIREFPDEYHLFSERSFTFNGISQNNRNPLLALGADGLKTGHTQAAGYGLVASAQEDGRRVVFALSRMDSAAERAREAEAMMNYGLQDFEQVTIADVGETVTSIPVRDGVAESVELHPGETVSLLVPAGSLSSARRVVRDNGPVEAPVVEGQRLGWLELKQGEETIREVPLLARRAVERSSFFERIGQTIADHLTWR